MIKRILLSELIILLFIVNAYSQDEKIFNPNRRPIFRIYTNYHATFFDNKVSKVFEIQRAYLGYQYQFSKYISGQLILDVANPKLGDLQMTAYLKNAFVQYQKDNLTARVGMIGLMQFKLQEDLWGGRYFYKSFMDEHKFGSSADIGAFIEYKILDALSADITIANGEGYKKVQTDSIFKYSGGVTYHPILGLTLRASYDYMGKDKPQQTIAIYAGYNTDKVRFGAEYNYQLNHTMIANIDLMGISFYGSFQLNTVRLFGRFDNLSSQLNGISINNFALDGQLFIVGLEFNPVKGIRVSPHFQAWNPKAQWAKIASSVYLSIEILF